MQLLLNYKNTHLFGKMREANFRQFILILLFLFSHTLFAAGLSSGTEILGDKFDLNNTSVRDLYSNASGFVWVATDYGISRYDGFRFKDYPLLALENPALKAEALAVDAIYEIGDGLLLLLLQQGGIACFDTKSEEYISILFSGQTFDKRKITSIYVADKSLLYMGTVTGLYCADVNTVNGTKDKRLNLNLSKPLLTGNVSEIAGDGKGSLFLCIDSDRVLQYSMGTQQTREYSLKDENLQNQQNSSVSFLYVVNNYLFVGLGSDNLVCFEINGRNSRDLVIRAVKGQKISEIHISHIICRDELNFYLASDNGIFCLTFDSKDLMKAAWTLSKISDKKQLTALFWNPNQKLLWYGAKEGGINSFKRDNHSWKNNINFPIDSEIEGVEEDAMGNIWVVARKSGIWKSTSHSSFPNLIFESWEGDHNREGTFCIYKDKRNNLWFGDENSGIIFVNTNTGETRHIRLKPSGWNDFSSGIKSLCLDGQERLWVVTTRGLVLLDNKSGNCSLQINNNFVQGIEIYSVAVDSDDNIWVGTDSGIKKLNLLPGKVELTGDYEKEAGYEPSAANLIYVNKSDQIFAVYANKVLRIDPVEKKPALVFDLLSDLRSGRVICMADDKDRNTWMGCSSGIAMLRYGQNIVYNTFFGESCEKVCSLKNGEMLWADSNCLFYFSSIGNSKENRKLVLSEVWINGNELKTDDTNNFVFCENANLHFNFKDINFDGTSQAIVYRLLPNEDWQSGILKNGISYRELSHGNYKLQVKLIYPNGSEGDLIELSLTVRPPWWKTEWAYAAYCLLFIALLFVVYRLIISKRHNKRSLTEVNGRDIESTNDGLYGALTYRIIKDLSNPLSMIIGLLKEIIQNKGNVSNKSFKLLLLYRNAVGLRKACSQFLEIRDYEQMDMRLSIANYSMTEVINTFLFSMNELIQIYSVEFEYRNKEENLLVWVDKNKIEFLLRNLTTNALMRMNYSGKLILSVDKELDGDREYCVITISDDGKRKLKTIQQTSDDELINDGSVFVILGLRVTEEIVHRHHGTISIHNDVERGTDITLKLPINKAVFDNNRNVDFVSPEKLDIPEFSTENLIDIKKEEAEDDSLITIPEEFFDSKKADREKSTVLVVEDNTDIRLYLKVLLENEFNVLQASNGVEGVKVAKLELPDLIICDIMMPLKDGYQCCKEIKEGLETCHIPVIMLTAKIEDEDVVKGLEAGADDYILKPFKPNILKARVKSLIQGRISLKQMYANLLKPSMEVKEGEEVREASAKIEDPFIGKVIKIIEDNIQEEDFSVKKLASELNMSQPTLYRKVKLFTDYTIIELIRGVRLKKAASLLLTRQFAVQEVAEMVGYNDIPTFRKHFVDMFGATPSTYAASDPIKKE